MADTGQTNPESVVITPVSNTTTIGSQTGQVPLAGGARVQMPSGMGRIPTSPTPITPVGRRK
jgi:hypothetical protein